MKTHDLIQGTPEWHQFRLDHYGASEAAAMLGLSKKASRTELLHMKHTGIAKEFSDFVQEKILDRGHEVEALARPLVSAIIGDDLYPVTCSNGIYSASCDGLTMDGETAFEHKQWNKELAASVSAGELPEEYMPQCQQVMMVTGAMRLIFVVSDGTSENMVHMEIAPDTEWFRDICAGWDQFTKDLAEYVPAVTKDKPIAEAVKDLPVLFVSARGEVTDSNMPKFQEAADAFLATIKTDLQTDQDFADAEAVAKKCRETETKLVAVKDAVIAQAVSIGEAVAIIDEYKERFRVAGLKLEKLVKEEKESRRLVILSNGKEEYSAHVSALEAEIKPMRLSVAAPNFAESMKGKKSIKGWQDGVNDALAAGKIAADAEAKEIRAKLAWCKENAEGYGFLFNDLQQIIVKPMDDFKLLVQTRIADHKKAEEANLEAERMRIRQEEEAKAQAKAQAESVAPEEKPAAIEPVAETQPAKESRVAVIEHQDEISAFLASRDFGKEANKVRAVLVEFVKFQESYALKAAA